MATTFNRKVFVAGIVALSSAALAQAGTIGISTADGYTFTDFDFPNSGNAAGAGTNVNGIGNNGAAVGFSIGDNGEFTNFVRNAGGSYSTLNLSGLNPMALGINSAGDVVGQQNGAGFFLPPGGSPQTLAGTTMAFGVNDQGNIVGQYNSGAFSPGFFLSNSAAGSFVSINAPTGPDIVNPQGINDNGLMVGYYLGTDGQDHGFYANIANARNGFLPAAGIADPRLPSVPGEPGATFVFSQILGINDSGIAVGYYGDSTTSEHGFFYNTNTGAYTFLDDPAEQFDNGTETTQITGINNSGEIAGFYSDGSGVFHGFVACPTGTTCSTSGPSPTPEPASWLFVSFGLSALALGCWARLRWNSILTGLATILISCVHGKPVGLQPEFCCFAIQGGNAHDPAQASR